jgi:glyoxylate reductase
MRILYHDVHRASPEDEAALGAEYAEMDDLLAEADFLSLHVNLSDETRHLLDAEAFRRMKSSAIVVNTSRGPVIDQKALFEALRDGVIGGAALDVTDPEPMPADDPLLTLPNCLVVPHIASASHRTRRQMAEMAAANLLAGLRGEQLPNQVNPEVAPRS